MGKPIEREIKELESTYQWACNIDVTKIADFLRTSWQLPLFSVGSGGSFSAAEIHSTLHRVFFRSIAQAVTPMDLLYSLPQDGNASIWFLSASGNNVDIKRSFQHAALHEPKAVSALIGSKDSQIAHLATKYQYSNIFEYVHPNGRDGFLATNTLLGFAIILYRAYCLATNVNNLLPVSIETLIYTRLPVFSNFANLQISTKDLLTQNVNHIIYSPLLKSTALDIESKFIEAGLGSIHLSDLRNFAHGRHHWFSKNVANNGILVLSTQKDKTLGTKLLDLLPNYTTKVDITFKEDNGTELIAGILLSIYLTSWRGKLKGIDPGRPKVPNYGSKIYRLTSNPGFVNSIREDKASIERKIRSEPISYRKYDLWNDLYQNYLKNIKRQKFGGIIFDYDGTIVDNRCRKDPPSNLLCQELHRLLKLGLKIGFATGRGRSIREALQQPGIIPKKYWEQVLIGYYNCSDINLLSNCKFPDGSDGCHEDLLKIVEYLKKNIFLSYLNPEFTLRKKQVTVEPKTLISESFLWNTVKDALGTNSSLSAEIVRSSHSIDILSAGITKLSLLNKIKLELCHGLEILSIGDNGRWPGNDYALLSTPFSLSVDEVSDFGDRCWNLCPAGVKGPQGTLHYLKKIEVTSGVGYFK